MVGVFHMKDGIIGWKDGGSDMQWHISFWFGTAEEQNFGCVDSPWSRQTKDITTWVYRTRHPKYHPIAWYISSKFSKSGWMSFTHKHIFMLFWFRDIPWLTSRISSTLSTSSAQGFFARMERSMLAADAERVVPVTKLDGRGWVWILRHFKIFKI